MAAGDSWSPLEKRQVSAHRCLSAMDCCISKKRPCPGGCPRSGVGRSCQDCLPGRARCRRDKTDIAILDHFTALTDGCMDTLMHPVSYRHHLPLGERGRSRPQIGRTSSDRCVVVTPREHCRSRPVSHRKGRGRVGGK